MSTQDNTECGNPMKPGDVGWHELATSDTAAAIAFYTKLFGWETEPFPMENGEYTIFKANGVPFGGVMKAPHEGMPTFWLNYVVVKSVDESIGKARSLGAEVVFEPMDIAGVGRIAVIKDPQGGAIGLHQGPE